LRGLARAFLLPSTCTSKHSFRCAALKRVQECHPGGDNMVSILHNLRDIAERRLAKLKIAPKVVPTTAETSALLGATIAKMPAIAAIAEKSSLGRPLIDHCKLRPSECLDGAALPFLARTDPEAARKLTITELVNASLDKTRIREVLDCAIKLGHDGPFVQKIAHEFSALNWTEAPTRTVDAITVVLLPEKDAIDWLFRYRAKPSPVLAARFRELSLLPAGTLGRAYWEEYQRNGRAFPGEQSGINVAVAVPHDCTHLLSGYDTSPVGEVLTAAFTAAMHPSCPAEAHLLPCLFDWDLGIQINRLAVSASGALDPGQFWLAWARGTCSRDLFAPGWDFWSCASMRLDDLRESHNIPPLNDGLT